MDKLILDLVVGAASNGLWSLLGRVGGGALQAVKEHLSKSDALTETVAVAAASVAERFPLGAGSERERIVRFLESPEIESLVRQLYAIRLIGKEGAPEGTVEGVRREFTSLLSLHLDVTPAAIQAAAEALFQAILTACTVNLTRAVGQGALGAHESLSIYRHKRLLDELAVIERNLLLLAGTKGHDISSILAFEEKYRSQVGDRHGHIQPPHFDSGRKVPIDELFVAPRFFSPSRRKRVAKSGRADLGIEALAESIYRLVIVGNPGGGKSTVATKLVHQMATQYSARPVASRELTPILVVLREYGRLKKEQNCSILQFIEIQANATYQVAAPQGAFEYLLLNGRAFVVFDGLDELLDTSYRQEISANVGSFCTLYPNVPVLVTSREVGYEQAPLDEEKFSLVKVAPFDEQQVAEYSQKWFARDDDYSAEQQQQKARAFLTESSIAPDLRSNPLMLGLMCNLYKVEGYIPRNRADVYEKCSVMLFERWDKGRGIVVQLPFEAHVRPAMQHLAYWIYSEESLQGGVTRQKLVNQTTEYLSTWVFDNAAEARKAADEFVEFCTGRAWVFTDTGTTADGEKLYQFTHRTFLEYFAASYLSSIHPTPEQLVEVLRPRIRKEEWDVVAILSFQMLSRRVQGAADVLLMGLLGAWQSRYEQAASIAFAGRCLESIVPSPKVRRAIAQAAVDFAVECGAHGLSAYQSEKPRRRRSLPFMVLGALVSATAENRPTVAEVILKGLVEKVLAGTEEERLSALEIALNPGALGPRPHQLINGEDSQFWRSIFSSVSDAAGNRLRDDAAKDLGLCRHAVARGFVQVTDLLEWHGTASLFMRTLSRCMTQPRVGYANVLIPRLLSCALGDSSEEELVALENEVASVGRWLAGRDTPWLRSTEASLSSASYEYDYLFESALVHSGNIADPKPKNLGPDALFGGFCLLALLTELRSHIPLERSGAILKALKGSNVILLIRIVDGRSSPISEPKLTTFMERCGFNGNQAKLIRRWLSGEIILTDVGRLAEGEHEAEVSIDLEAIEHEDLEEGSPVQDDTVSTA